MTAAARPPRRDAADASEPAVARARTPGRWACSASSPLLLFTKLIQPNYGVTGIQGLAISVLPLALAAVGQAIVVISGGIDLSIGAMMALTSVVAASLMKGQSEEFGVARRRRRPAAGPRSSARSTAALIVVTRVPDIVVTLAMSFVWAGCALLVLKTPGRRRGASG